MAANPGSISSQPAAATLSGAELLPLDQDIGSPVLATALVVGQGYRIVTLGNTNWQTVGAGASAAVGTVFRCEAVGTGTGTAQRVDTRRVTAQAIAARALQDPTAAPTFAGLTVTGTATAAQFDGNLTGAVSSHCRNVSGVALAALTPLNVTGSQGDTTILEVVAARSDTPGRMPAAGLALAALGTSGSAANGHLVAAGVIAGVNTAGLTSGAPLFVAAAGGITATRPTTGLVQVVAVVGRAHATTGTVVVSPGPALPLAAFTGAYGDLSGRPTLGSAAAAATADFDPAGAASAAITAHLLAASHHAPASLAASLQTVFGLSGQELAAQSPGAGLTRLHYWNPATSRLEFLALGTSLSIASGQLNAADLYNLLLPSAAGTYFQYLSSNSVTNGGAGAAASAFTGGMASSSTLPTMGRLDTGTAATGASGLVPSSANAWTGIGGKLSLQAIRSFQTTIWFVSPTTLSGGANTYRIFFGWLDSNTYSARNSIGLLINGSALTITSTVAGVESSTALATVAANTNYKVTLIYDASTATISANINGGAYITFAIPSTPTTLGMLGVFIAKETGTTSITFYTSVPQFHTGLSC
jgi:hypothetical protein